MRAGFLLVLVLLLVLDSAGVSEEEDEDGRSPHPLLITPLARLQALRTTRQTWMDASTAQTESKASAQSQRAELKAALKSIEDRKVAIQLAADAQWAHTDEANAGIRGQFAFPTKRPLVT